VNGTVLELETADGVRIVAHRHPPAGAASGITVVVVHGFAASSSEGRVRALADALAGAGHRVFTYDSRGHGESGGEATLGADEPLDVAAVVGGAGEGPVVLVGASMGAIGALRYAVEQPARPPVGVVVVSCPARWTLPRNARGVLSALMTQTPVGRWAARRYVGVRIARPRARPAPPIELVPGLRVPLAVVHGAADPFIPVADAEALHDVAREPRHLAVVAGMGHAFEAPSVEPIVGAVAWVIERADGS
jgi:pimeloyl-ACP methyl ester carboxylesterase